MPYIHGITKEDVFNAASTIFAQGKNPTQASVREALGKGSFSTISKYLAEWRNEQTDSESLATTTEDMPDNIRLLLNRTYAAIRAHAESDVTSERLSVIESQNERLLQENIELKQDLIDLPGLRSAYHEALGRLQDLARENERINKFLPQVDQMENLVEELAKLATVRGELETQNHELDLAKSRLEDQLATRQRDLETSIDGANEMADRFSVLEQTNRKLNKEVTKAGDRNLELNEKLKSYEDLLVARHAEIEELKNEIKISKEAATPPARKPRKSRATSD